jgi:flagellar biosynthetic protein FlhB
MAEDTDQESKTEKATEKRIRDALEKGNKPFSKETVTLGSIVAMLAASALIMQYAVGDLQIILTTGLGQAGTIRLEAGGDASKHLFSLATRVGQAVVPVLIVLSLGGIIGALAQNMPSANLNRIAPKLERLSPAKNFTQIFGKMAAIEMAATLVKLLAGGLLAFWITRQLFGDVLQLALTDPAMLLTSVGEHATSILLSVVILCIAIAIVDLIVVRHRWAKKLMMTRQEVKDEHKQLEGDPLVKQRIQILGRKRRNNRMMADVPKATMLVVNPTHFAVAMRYVAEEGGAPVVVAKGMDHLAARIRQICEEHKIPVVENPPLARALHKSVAVGAMIPVEFYRAVAEVIHFIELRRRLNS